MDREPEPPPPPPPPPPLPTPRSGWTPPGTPAGGPRLDVGSIVGRTFDTYGREWSLFLVLALPAALASFAQAIAIPDSASGAYGTWSLATDAEIRQALEELAGMIVVATLGSLVSGLGMLAMVVATDRMWQAQPATILGSVTGALRAAPRAIVLWLMLVLALAVLAVVASLGATLLVVGAGAVGLIGFLGLAAVVVVGLIVVAVRLTPILVVVAVERAGVLASISRTWELTRGHVIMLFVTGFVIGLCASLGSYGSSLIAAGIDSRVIVGLASGMASLVAAPLSAIWVTIAWGDLVGGRHRDSAAVARGTGRWVSAALVAGLGVVLLIIGLATVAGTLSSQTLVP